MKLLEKFSSQVKWCGKIKRVWLTTFNLDIEFVETYILPAIIPDAEPPRTRADYEALQLSLNELRVDFRVFCDKRYLSTDQNKRTSVPIHGISPGQTGDMTQHGFTEESLFHAKVIYIEGETGSCLGTGSANLTLSGWGRNREVFIFSPVDSSSIYREICAFFSPLFKNVGEPFPLDAKRTFHKADSAATFSHSFQATPFLGQLFNGQQLKQLAVWSPYFPSDLSAFIYDLKSRFMQPDLKIHLVGDLVENCLRTRWNEGIQDLAKQKILNLYNNPAPCDERVTMTHAKLWKTPDRIAIGSWNFTRSGANTLVNDSGQLLPGNNIEAGLILQDTSSPLDYVGKELVIDPSLFATEKLLEEEKLQVPETPPFDLHVVFDWSKLAYEVSGVWNHALPEEGEAYSLKLPDLEKEVRLDWMFEENSLKKVTLQIHSPAKVFLDHTYQIIKEGKPVFSGMIIEAKTENRRAQQYEDLKSLVDAMIYPDPPPQEGLPYRLSETEGGEIIFDGRPIGGDSASYTGPQYGSDEISYFRLFIASYQYASRLKEIGQKRDLRDLEQWAFTRPGSLEELASKAKDRIISQGLTVFNWFLAEEVNNLCGLAVQLRENLWETSGSIPSERWSRLGVEMPGLPEGAFNDYAAHIMSEFKHINSHWGEA